jgi:hypothetical protein
MSTVIVPIQHIQVLVHTAIEGVIGDDRRYGPVEWYTLPWRQLEGIPYHELSDFRRQATADRAQVLGQMLLDENVVSYGHLYPEQPIDAYPLWARLPYHHERLPFRLTPVECLKAIEGYVYQAEEHDGWCDSESYQFCEALRMHAIQSLDGWREAPVLFDHVIVNARASRSASAGRLAFLRG